MRRSSKPPIRKTYTAAAVEHFAASGLGVIEMRRMGITEYGPLECPQVRWVRYPTLGIPYHDPRGKQLGFTRYRVLTDDEEEPKYTQPKGSGIHLYFPPVLPGGWERVLTDRTTPILITEGEKKAAAACLLGFATIGIAGVDCGGKDGHLLPDWSAADLHRRMIIIYDSDAALNRHSQEAAERLASMLRQRGADVFIVILPANGEKKVGLDDFIQQEPETARERLNELLDTPKRHVLPELELNDEYAVVLHGSKTLVLHEDRLPDGTLKINFYRPNDLAPLFENRLVKVKIGERTSKDGTKEPIFKTVSIFRAWMQSRGRREFKRVVFQPEGCADTEYNLWQGFSVQPREGDCTLFKEFLRDVICSGDLDHYDYLLKWLAMLFQRPGIVPRTSIVMRGGQGTGKSTLADIIGSLMAAHYVTVVAAEQLVGKFNGHTEGAVLLLSDEAVFPGDKRSEGILKTLVTQEWRGIERKGIDRVKVRNCVHLMFATNHDWAVALDPDDRRYLVLQVSDAHADDRAYFAKLHASMNAEGKAALLHFLLNYPADDFFTLKPPKTRGHLEQKLRSLLPIDAFWLDCLAAGGIVVDGEWPEVVPTAAVQARWEQVRVTHGGGRSARTELGMALSEFVPGLVNKRVSVNSRQVPHYVFPALAFCRAAFARRFGKSVTWADVAAVLGITEDAACEGDESSRPSRPKSKTQSRNGKVVGVVQPTVEPDGQLGRLPLGSQFNVPRRTRKF